MLLPDPNKTKRLYGFWEISQQFMDSVWDRAVQIYQYFSGIPREAMAYDFFCKLFCGYFYVLNEHVK